MGATNYELRREAISEQRKMVSSQIHKLEEQLEHLKAEAAAIDAEEREELLKKQEEK